MVTQFVQPSFHLRIAHKGHSFTIRRVSQRGSMKGETADATNEQHGGSRALIPQEEFIFYSRCITQQIL